MTSAIDRAGQLFALQRAAVRRDGEPDLALRLDRLRRLDALITAHEHLIIDAIDADFGGRARTETKLYEVYLSRVSIRHAIKNLKRWMKPQRARIALANQPGRGWIRHQPLGAVGIISPWNYPLLLAVSPLNDALAAGNRALLKPSEHTPQFSGVLAEAIARTFGEDEVAVVMGGPDVARAFASLPFDHLLFTGSTRIGREVSKAAAPNMTPVTLELGGKSPAIILPSANLKRAARSIAFGKFINAGQTCIAPDYVFVPEAQADEFAGLVLAEIRQTYPHIAANPDYSALISSPSYDRLRGAVAEAEGLGARVITHGDADADRRRFPPTLLLSPPDTGTLATEEIFGPVLPIRTYRRLDEVIAHLEHGEKPLALYCFGRDRREIDRIVSGTSSGGVTINGTLLHIAQDNLPFGGVGQSGMGAYHGEAGFKRFSHARAIFKAGPIIGLEMFAPPYGARTARLLHLLERFTL